MRFFELNYFKGSSNRIVAAEWKAMLILSMRSCRSVSEMPKLGSTRSPLIATSLSTKFGFFSATCSNNYQQKHFKIVINRLDSCINDLPCIWQCHWVVDWATCPFWSSPTNRSCQGHSRSATASPQGSCQGNQWRLLQILICHGRIRLFHSLNNYLKFKFYISII